MTTPNANALDPHNTPDTLSSAGVRRVNNRPLIIVLVVACLFFLIVGAVAMKRASETEERISERTQPKENESALAHALEITGDSREGVIPPSVPFETSAEIDRNIEPPIVVQEPVEQLPAPPTVIQAIPASQTSPLPPQPTPEMQKIDEEADAIRKAKMRMFQEAIQSRLTVNSEAPRSSAYASQPMTSSPRTREEMLARINDVQAQIEANSGHPTDSQDRSNSLSGGERFPPAGALIGGDIPPPLPQQATNGEYSQFGQQAANRWELGSTMQTPKSTYELQTGFVIPATLISGINSDLPGQIEGQVSKNVYDSPTGKHLLIPQGSRLVGAYSSNIKFGQARILVAWQRIVFPDGKSLDIGNMPGATGAGYAGLKDQVNNHYFRTFASAVLMSGITAGVTLSQDNDNNSDSNSQRASDAMSEALGQQLGQLAAQMIARNLNVSPTLEIRPGFRFNVLVTKDIRFSKSYKPFDY